MFIGNIGKIVILYERKGFMLLLALKNNGELVIISIIKSFNNNSYQIKGQLFSESTDSTNKKSSVFDLVHFESEN